MAASVYSIRKLMNKSNPRMSAVEIVEKKKGPKAAVNKAFFKNLARLIKICIPKLASKESLAVFVLTSSLVARTILSIYMSEITSNIVKSIVKKDLTEFVLKILLLGFLALPGSFINSSLDFLNKKIAIYFRENLTNHFQNKIMEDMCYYKITNLDSRIKNLNQILSSDVDKFANSLTMQYSNLTKPLMDIILFSKKLSQSLGWQGPILLVGWYLLSGFIMKIISPPFGKLTAIEQSKFFNKL